MDSVDILGIMVNLFALLALVGTLVLYIYFRRDRVLCETTQSPFCPSISCPCDPQDSPAYGYASRDNNGQTEYAYT